MAKDRTSELRVKGFTGRRLGPIQMTTDTAVRVTRTIIQDKGAGAPKSGHRERQGTEPSLVPLGQIDYIDYPEIKIDEHESTEMPFRYMARKDGSPIMPEVCAMSFPNFARLAPLGPVIE